MKLVLASASPRRRELLLSVGLDFEVLPSTIEEQRGETEDPESYVLRLSREKAEEVAARRPEAWVIGADTTVYIDDTILEKPSDQADAARMLRTISGREHTVFTGITLLGPAMSSRESRVVSTQVTMIGLTDEEIAWYVGTGEPMDKAGAYAVQGVGAMFISSIHGNYTNVVGLPLSVLLDMMRRAGIDPLRPSTAKQLKSSRKNPVLKIP